MPTVTGRGVGWQQRGIIRICGVAGSTLRVEGVFRRSERIGGRPSRVIVVAGGLEDGAVQRCRLVGSGAVGFGVVGEA